MQVEFIGGLQFKIGQPVNASIMVRNFGVYPAKVVKMSLTTLITHEQPSFTAQQNDVYMDGNVYITKDNPLAKPVDNMINKNLDTAMYIRIVKEGYKIYIQGDVIYKNLVTNKNRRYKFIIGIDVLTKMINYPLNENEDIKQ